MEERRQISEERRAVVNAAVKADGAKRHRVVQMAETAGLGLAQLNVRREQGPSKDFWKRQIEMLTETVAAG